MNLSVKVQLRPIESSLTLVRFLSMTMEGYEKSDASGADAKRSGVYWFTGTGEEEAGSREGLETRWPCSSAGTEMNIIHKAMRKILELLAECGNLGAEVNEDVK